MIFNKILIVSVSLCPLTRAMEPRQLWRLSDEEFWVAVQAGRTPTVNPEAAQQPPAASAAEPAESEMLMKRFASNTLIIPNQPRLSQLTQIIGDAKALLEKRIATFRDPSARSRHIDVQAIKDDAQQRIDAGKYRVG